MAPESFCEEVPMAVRFRTAAESLQHASYEERLAFLVRSEEALGIPATAEPAREKPTRKAARSKKPEL